VFELARLTATDADGLGRLLRAGVTVGLFVELEDERFALTELGAQLLGAAPWPWTVLEAIRSHPAARGRPATRPRVR
jgi:hypothetical protein